MSSLKAYRFQLRPRPAAQAQLRRYAGMGRRVWNMALASQRARRSMVRLDPGRVCPTFGKRLDVAPPSARMRRP